MQRLVLQQRILTFYSNKSHTVEQRTVKVSSIQPWYSNNIHIYSYPLSVQFILSFLTQKIENYNLTQRVKVLWITNASVKLAGAFEEKIFDLLFALKITNNGWDFNISILVCTRKYSAVLLFNFIEVLWSNSVLMAVVLCRLYRW